MTRVRRLGALIAACAALASAPAQADEAYAVPGSSVRDVTSASGGAYRIYVARPEAPPPPNGYPVLYVLDGDDGFAVAAETARRLARYAPRSGVGPGLVVAVGYPGASRRSFDYTPAAKSPHGAPAGGAEAFLDFLIEELRPAIARDYPVDGDRQTLAGHSYGGLFVLYALFTQPDAFRSYVAISPSVWFGDGAILTREAPFARRFATADLQRTLAIGVGELEASEPGPAPRTTTYDAQYLAARLKTLEPSGLKTTYRSFCGEGHGTALLPGLAMAVSIAFGSRP